MGLLGSLFGGRPKVAPTHIADLATFQEQVLDSDLPVIVDVWSPTCGPCKKMAPELVEVATRHEGRVRVVEVSTEAEGALLARLDVRATPTILVFDEGKELGRMTGFRPAGWFHEMIETEFPAK